MWEFIDLIFFAGIAGAFIWLFIHHKRIQDPIINIYVNGNKEATHFTRTHNEDETGPKKNQTKAIDIEEPDRSNDWLNIEPTDSN